jgi:hypothetical protein
MPRKVLRDFVDYWRDGFGWRATERRLNSLPQFHIEMDGRVKQYSLPSSVSSQTSSQ